MEHEEYLEQISAALDGALPPAERRALDAHLARCPHCRAVWNDLAAAARVLRDLPPAEPPEDLTDRILAGLAPAPRRRQTWARWAALAAALVLLAAGGYRLTRPMGSAPSAAAQVPMAAPAAGVSGGWDTAPAEAEERSAPTEDGGPLYTSMKAVPVEAPRPAPEAAENASADLSALTPQEAEDRVLDSLAEEGTGPEAEDRLVCQGLTADGRYCLFLLTGEPDRRCAVDTRDGRVLWEDREGDAYQEAVGE